MTTRLVGSIFVCLGCGLYSYERIRRQKAELDSLKLLCDFVSFSNREIGYFQTPFPEICEKFADGRISDFAKFARGEKENPLRLSKDDEKNAKEYFSGIGGAFLDESVKMGEYYLGLLTKSYETKKADFPKKTKTEISLSLLVGAGISVILL